MKKQGAYEDEEKENADEYKLHKKEQMFQSGNQHDPKSPAGTPKDSGLPQTEEFPQASPQPSPPKKSVKVNVSEADKPESILTPENSFVKVREGIEKEQEIQRNLDLELVKLQ